MSRGMRSSGSEGRLFQHGDVQVDLDIRGQLVL